MVSQPVTGREDLPVELLQMHPKAAQPPALGRGLAQPSSQLPICFVDSPFSGASIQEDLRAVLFSAITATGGLAASPA